MSTPPTGDHPQSGTATAASDTASLDQIRDAPERCDHPAAVQGSDGSPPPIQIFPAETIVENLTIVDESSLPLRLWRWLGSGIEWCYGIACLFVLLAALASVPILQFISLGYLLEVSARISRSGRFRDGFFEIRTAARIGSLFAGTWLVMLPLRLAADLRYTSYLVDSSSGVTGAWQIGVAVMTGLTVVHILLAWYCGGQLRHFLWPVLAPLFFTLWSARRALSSGWLRPLVRPVLGTISPRLLHEVTAVPRLEEWFPPAILWAALRKGRIVAESRDAVWYFIVNLQVPHYFWLGLRGFAGAVIWLFVPILMVISSTKVAQGDHQAAAGVGGLLGFVGSLLLAAVILYLPFLQANFAAENRFRAMFQWAIVRAQFRRAPIAFWLALLITLLFAVPLYLLKVAVIPREVVWLPSLVFVAFIFPARMVTGWAVGRARHHARPRFFLFRWMARLVAIPVVLIYVVIVYFTQYTSWYGSWSLLEQHAFLTPVPFLGL